jgi:hypothetical protein
MELNSYIDKKGKPYWIPGASRRDLPAFFKSLGFKKGVEIGVSWGENIVDYCEAGLEIYGIDPWQDTRDNTYRKIVSIKGGRTIDEVYEIAKERTKKYPNCHLIKKLSLDALDDFPDRSLDFVYIDGNHGFGYVAMDLAQWCRKVRKGGIIAGHDYYSTEGVRIVRHVGDVVDAFVKSYDFENFWVLGTKDDFKDRDLSYFMIKHY